MDLRICGTIILAICAICGTLLFYKKLDNRHTETMTWAAAFDRRCDDRNMAERKNWSETNCDLAGQIASLQSELDSYKRTLSMAGIDDVAEFVKWVKEKEGKDGKSY
jgi:hypothetical protein